MVSTFDAEKDPEFGARLCSDNTDSVSRTCLDSWAVFSRKMMTELCFFLSDMSENPRFFQPGSLPAFTAAHHPRVPPRMWWGGCPVCVSVSPPGPGGTSLVEARALLLAVNRREECQRLPFLRGARPVRPPLCDWV